MKLKELLTVIPDNYLIGLMDSDPDNYSILVFGNKKDALFGYGQRACLLVQQVENLNVVTIHPGVNTYIHGFDMYGDDSAELHVKTQLLIELKSEGERKCLRNSTLSSELSQRS